MKSVLQAGKYRPLNMPNPYTMDNLPRTKSGLDDIYKQYMKDRMAGHIDAYGNTHPNFRREKIRHTDKYGNVTFKEVFMPSGRDDGYGGVPGAVPPGGGSGGGSGDGSGDGPCCQFLGVENGDDGVRIVEVLFVLDGPDLQYVVDGGCRM